ncbi:hypothetical protein GCM10023196_024870 [Actinoallomurus vinaceus]|uniref:Uncharacterized protein n=1 Tax=Actinoallomurus vinaceus TaxID=1080074 RepID=A0ABP8U5N2_9ACTN
MEQIVPAATAVIGQDLPEPTSYRGQHIISLPVDSDAWLTFPGISYWLDPVVEPGLEGMCKIYLLADEGFDLTCAAYDESGTRLPLGVVTADSGHEILAIQLKVNQQGGGTADQVHGNSLTFRLNYRGSGNVKDVVVPIDFGQPVVQALAGRHLYFRLTDQPLAFTSLAEQDRLRPEPKTPLIYLHGYEDPDTGVETIGTRLPPIALTRERIAAAWQTAKSTGYFDPVIFPNVAGSEDQAGRAGVLQAISGLDEATVVQQFLAGARLVVSRAPTGEYTYRFLAAPEHCRPGLVLVEYYRLTSFPARYGAGRTIKTFSLLPGEETSIRISTYKRSAESMQNSASILDATNSETQNEFARTVNSEQSNQSNVGKSFEYRAEAEAEGQANWGWGSASAKVSGGVSGSSNNAREELTKNLTNAVSQNTARASSRRDVQIDTSMDVKLEQGEETAVERTLENINVSRTLNFVFRQMNQEYVTLLHLVDVRVAFFNGHAESRDEVPLTDLDRLLGDCMRPESIAKVRAGIVEALQTINDYRGQAQPGFITTLPAEKDQPGTVRITPDFTSSYTGPDGREHIVPGIVVSADQYVLRTDGVTVDSFLGDGNALDDYSTGLQEQAVRARQVDNDRQQAETERLRLALRLIDQGDTAGAELYRTLFPTPQVVNQIDHAALTAVESNGQKPAQPPATAG